MATKKTTALAPYIVKNFTKGLITRIEEQTLPKGASSDSLNWMSMGDHIELRRGVRRLGAEVAGASRVSGLAVGRGFDGSEVLIYTHGRKIKTYDQDTDTTTEIGADYLPAEADGEDVSIEEYHSLAGAMLYLSSPSSSIYKMPIANPGSIVDLKSTDFRGKIKIDKGSMFLWDRADTSGGSDKTGLYRSWGDKVQLSEYTNVTKENVGAGDGNTKHFVGSLAAVAGVKTGMYVLIAGEVATRKNTTAITKATQAQITATGHGLVAGDPVIIAGVVGMTEINNLIASVVSVVDANNITVNIDSTAFTNYSSAGTIAKAERFVDDRNGNLSSLAGGTGTVDYATGDFDLTFNTAPKNATSLFADYYTEDATDEGLADFSFSGSRTAGQGFVLRQDDGGAEFQNMGTIAGSKFCLHTSKTYKLDIDTTDLIITNLIYRNRVGVEYWRGMKETGDGIYYVDSLDQEEAAVRILQPSQFSNEVIPKSISSNLVLSDFRFERVIVFEYGNFIVMECRSKSDDANSTTFVFNKLWKLWDKLDFRASCFAELDGKLVFGDAASGDIFEAFNGVSDEDANILNHWISGSTNLDAEGVKEANLMVIRGLIQKDQILEISFSYDDSDFVKVGEVRGDGPYMNQGQKFYIGANGIGAEPIGSGGDGLAVAPYALEFAINTDRFEYIRVKFEATQIGYVSVSEYQLKDLRYKGRSLPVQFTA